MGLKEGGGKKGGKLEITRLQRRKSPDGQYAGTSRRWVVWGGGEGRGGAINHVVDGGARSEDQLKDYGSGKSVCR